MVAPTLDGTGKTKKTPGILYSNPWRFCEELHSGSDGLGVRAGCFIWSPRNEIYHLVIRMLVKGVQS